MPEKLKPCPFCGFKRPKMRRFDTDAYRVVCLKCGSQGAPCFIHQWHDSVYIAQGNATKAWNRRAENVRQKEKAL